MKELEGTLSPGSARIGIVVSRFNDFITDRLLEGAISRLRSLGVDMDGITVARCPGAFEIPSVAKRMAVSGSFDAVVALGCVIRGETTHYDFVAGEAAAGVRQAALDTGVPVIFGVITTETVEQALARSAPGENKGAEAVEAAVEMVDLYRSASW